MTNTLQSKWRKEKHIFLTVHFLCHEYLFILSMQGCALWVPSVLQYIQCPQTWRTGWWNHIVNPAVWKSLQLQVIGSCENRTETINVHLAQKSSVLIPKWRTTVSITFFFLLTHNHYHSSTYVKLQETDCMWGMQLFCSPLYVVVNFACRDIMLFSGLWILHSLIFVKHLMYSNTYTYACTAKANWQLNTLPYVSCITIIDLVCSYSFTQLLDVIKSYTSKLSVLYNSGSYTGKMVFVFTIMFVWCRYTVFWFVSH